MPDDASRPHRMRWFAVAGLSGLLTLMGLGVVVQCSLGGCSGLTQFYGTALAWGCATGLMSIASAELAGSRGPLLTLVYLGSVIVALGALLAILLGAGIATDQPNALALALGLGLCGAGVSLIAGAAKTLKRR